MLTKIIGNFVQDIWNEIDNNILEALNATWEDFCVQRDIPTAIIANHTLTVWGEETDDEAQERYFSVFVTTCNEDICFSIDSESLCRNDLEKAIVAAVNRIAKQTVCIVN